MYEINACMLVFMANVALKGFLLNRTDILLSRLND